MPHEVKMPQLGMTQDSGVIVGWLKAQGDKVSVGEALFEVETDKATMEVEAASDGYLAGIRAAAGDDVPVGDLIAVIVETEDAVGEFANDLADDLPSTAEMVQDADEQNAKLEKRQEPQSTQTASASDEKVAALSETTRPISSNAGRQKVLASPRAKRIASERGLDLVALKMQGVMEPIHVADLDRATGGGQSALTARVSGNALIALLDRSENPDRTTLIAAFAAGAWRQLFEQDDVAIFIRALDGTVANVTNPDRGGHGSAEQPALSLIDLCDTRLTSFAAANGGTCLSAARDGEDFILSLAFDESALALPTAIALLDQISARVEDPIRQLL